jgi:hypothetical protein
MSCPDAGNQRPDVVTEEAIIPEKPIPTWYRGEDMPLTQQILGSRHGVRGKRRERIGPAFPRTISCFVSNFGGATEHWQAD